MKVICSRSSPSQSKIGQRYFSKSFNAKARRVSVKEISKRYLRLSSASKPRAEICKDTTMPYYQKLGEMPRKHHIWFHRDGPGPGYKNEGIYYEHVVTTEGFNEAYSIMYHLRPPTRVRNVKLLKCEELKKVTDSPLRHHHLKTADIPRKGDLYTGRIPILFNQAVIAYRVRPEEAYAKFEYYKNGGA